MFYFSEKCIHDFPSYFEREILYYIDESGYGLCFIFRPKCNLGSSMKRAYKDTEIIVFSGIIRDKRLNTNSHPCMLHALFFELRGDICLHILERMRSIICFHLFYQLMYDCLYFFFKCIFLRKGGSFFMLYLCRFWSICGTSRKNKSCKYER